MRFYTPKTFDALVVGDILVARDTERRYRVVEILTDAIAVELLVAPIDVTTLPVWLVDVPGDQP